MFKFLQLPDAHTPVTDGWLPAVFTATPLLPMTMTSPRHLLNKYFLSGVANMLIEVIIATKRAQWIVILPQMQEKNLWRSSSGCVSFDWECLPRIRVFGVV